VRVPKIEMTRGRKAILVLIATAPIGLAIFSFLFMVRSELAFDETTCPFVEREVRELAEGIRIREEERTCQSGIEEHRWVVLRDGEEDYPIGQRRLSAELYADYSWTAEVRGTHVRLEITDPSLDFPRVFNERLEDAGVPVEESPPLPG